MWCVKNNRIQKFKRLLKSPKIDLNLKDLNGDTIALYALKHDKEEILKELIMDERTDINVKDIKGKFVSDWYICFCFDNISFGLQQLSICIF